MHSGDTIMNHAGGVSENYTESGQINNVHLLLL